MQTKPCSKCKKELPFELFNKDKTKTSGLSSQCKDCKKPYATKYRDDNAIKLKQWRHDNRDHLNAYSKKHHAENKERRSKSNKEWRENNKEHLKEYNSTRTERQTLNAREWRKNNRERNKDNSRKLQKKYREDPVFRICTNVSRAVRQALTNQGLSKSNASFFQHVNYTLDELKERLQSQLKSSMSWSNYGEFWSIDHLLPQDMYKYESMEDANFRKVWSLLNLAPLECAENSSKNNKLLPEHIHLIALLDKEEAQYQAKLSQSTSEA